MRNTGRPVGGVGCTRSVCSSIRNILVFYKGAGRIFHTTRLIGLASAWSPGSLVETTGMPLSSHIYSSEWDTDIFGQKANWWIVKLNLHLKHIHSHAKRFLSKVYSIWTNPVSYYHTVEAVMIRSASAEDRAELNVYEATFPALSFSIRVSYITV